MRSAIEGWVYTHLCRLEEKTPTLLSDALSDDIQAILPRACWQGADQVQASLSNWLAQQERVRVHVKRLLVDEMQRAAAVEWVLRTTPVGGGATQQLLGIAVLGFDEACRLSECHVRWDGPRSGPIAHIHAPWPVERWIAAESASTTRQQVESAAQRLAEAWTSRQREHFLTLVHDEVHLCPPWDYRIAPAGFMVIVDYHFSAYRDTCVTVERVIYDEAQPTFGVVMQTFACTNAATGRRGADADIAFVEVVADRLRYWRNYFDAEASVQTSYAEIGRIEQEIPS
jgi:hypothetical protein